MQTENRFFADLARVASGAIGTLGGLRDEIEARVKERVERFANEMDLVTREEFDAVQAMAAKARAGQERLEDRLAALEAELATLKATGAPDRRGTASRPASKAGTASEAKAGKEDGPAVA